MHAVGSFFQRRIENFTLLIYNKKYEHKIEASETRCERAG